MKTFYNLLSLIVLFSAFCVQSKESSDDSLVFTQGVTGSWMTIFSETNKDTQFIRASFSGLKFPDPENIGPYKEKGRYGVFVFLPKKGKKCDFEVVSIKSDPSNYALDINLSVFYKLDKEAKILRPKRLERCQSFGIKSVKIHAIKRNLIGAQFELINGKTIKTNFRLTKAPALNLEKGQVIEKNAALFDLDLKDKTREKPSLQIAASEQAKNTKTEGLNGSEVKQLPQIDKESSKAKSSQNLPRRVEPSETLSGNYQGVLYAIQAINPHPVPDTFKMNAGLDKAISFEFQGSCSGMLALKTRVTNYQKYDWSKFFSDRVYSNLPINLQDGFLSSLKLLQSQCPELKALRIALTLPVFMLRAYADPNELIHSSEQFYIILADEENTGRVYSANDPSPYDKDFRFSFAQKNMDGPASVFFNGTCEENPTLVVRNHYNYSDFDKTTSFTLGGALSIMKSTAITYRQECPNTESIRYVLNPLPDEYMCKEPGDCFVHLHYDPDYKLCNPGECQKRKFTGGAPIKNEWHIDQSEIRRVPYPPILNFEDITEVLAAGRFDILKSFDNYFAFYFSQFIYEYSDRCKNIMGSHSVLRMQQVRQELGEWGEVLFEDRGPVFYVSVEDNYLDLYLDYDRRATVWAAGVIVRKQWKAVTKGVGGSKAVNDSYAFLLGNAVYIENLIGSGCKAHKVQRVYSNMLRHAKGEEAQTGTYKTNKEVWVPPITGQPSAVGY